jgi:hypothetical protein
MGRAEQSCRRQAGDRVVGDEEERSVAFDRSAELQRDDRAIASRIVRGWTTAARGRGGPWVVHREGSGYVKDKVCQAGEGVPTEEGGYAAERREPEREMAVGASDGAAVEGAAEDRPGDKPAVPEGRLAW